MSKVKKFIRSFAGDGVPVAVDDEKRVIEGYAAVFNQRSKLVYDYNLWKPVIESIAPGAITDELVSRSDVVANLEHNNRRMLARSNMGKGTLTLTVDAVGLKYRFECPATADGDFAYEMVKRGDIGGSSFCYYNDVDETNVTYSKTTDENGKEVVLRTVNKIDHLYDVAIVLHPAYVGTSVEARNAEAEFINAAIKRSLGEPPAGGGEPSPTDTTDADMAAAECAILECELSLL